MFKKVPPSVIPLGLVSFFNDIASEMIYPILPIFLTQVLGAPVFVLGVIEGVAEGASAFFRTIFGIWSDKLQKRKPFVFSGYFASAISKIIIAASVVWPTVFLARVLDRFGKGLRTGARDAMLLAQTNTNNKGFIFGLHRSFDSAGAVAGPIIALGLIQFTNGNLRNILYLAIVPSFIGLLFFIFIKERKKQPSFTKSSFSFSLKNISPKLKQFLLVIGLFSLGNSSNTFLILRARDLGLSLSMVVLAYILYNIVYTVFSTPAGKISDKIGAKKVFLIGILIYVIVYFGFAINISPLVVWPLFAVYGLYIALTDGVSKALVGSFITPLEAGSVYGIVASVVTVFTLLASVIGGFLWSAFSPTATFLFGGICAILAFFLFVSQEFEKKGDRIEI